LKKTAKGNERFIIKLLLNGLYGFFGSKPIDDIVECIHSDEIDKILQTFSVKDIIEFEDSKLILVRRKMSPSIELMKMFEIKEHSNLLKEQPKTISNVAIASAITAYARIHLYSFIEKINPFNEYVNHFYPLKKSAKGNERFIIKLLLNGLYGYFGSKHIENLVECIHNSKLYDIMKAFPIHEIIELEDSDYLVIKKD
jgi:hypothetical protein